MVNASVSPQTASFNCSGWDVILGSLAASMETESRHLLNPTDISMLKLEALP